jgi:hypothetical protein
MVDQIFRKVASIAHAVRNDLRKKGFVVPVKNKDGSISFDSYLVVKESTGFYSIRNRIDDKIVDHINLPQTAALLANRLALGYFVDDRLIESDRQYGYSLFYETLAKKQAENSLKRKDIDRADLMYTKYNIARTKKIEAKTTIMASFEKLRRLNK